MSETDGKMADFGLEHDAWGRLVLIDAQGVRHVGVEPVRGFPISDPDRWIAICDSEGRELVSVEDTALLAGEVRRVLEQDLARREFVPLVRRILNEPPDAEPTTWEIETDRGNTRLVLNSPEDVRRLGAHRALVIDSHGIRYLIADVGQLDPASRRILERYI